jgi:signal transduction histidine kinase
MQRLMTLITGRVHRNGSKFYSLLSSGEIKPDCGMAELEGQIVILTPETRAQTGAGSSGQPDGPAWMFTKAELNIKKETYIQITATDITERWVLTAELRRRNEELKRKGDEIIGAIANLQALSHEQETQKTKARAHDFLSEKLTMALRAIQSKQVFDYKQLRHLTHTLMDAMKADHNKAVPLEELNNLCRIYESIGVIILVNGELPEETARGRLLIDIIKEGAANAVRHGFATEVSVKTGYSDGMYRLTITDNGRPLSDSFKEGGGIGGIREMIKPYGGALTVITQPGFSLRIALPDWPEPSVLQPQPAVATLPAKANGPGGGADV